MNPRALALDCTGQMKWLSTAEATLFTSSDGSSFRPEELAYRPERGVRLAKKRERPARYGYSVRALKSSGARCFLAYSLRTLTGLIYNYEGLTERFAY